MAIFLLYQVLDFPIKTFVCFLVNKQFLMFSDRCHRDASKLLLLIYHFLYFTVTSIYLSEFTQYHKRSSFMTFFLRIFFTLLFKAPGKQYDV